MPPVFSSLECARCGEENRNLKWPCVNHHTSRQATVGGRADTQSVAPASGIPLRRARVVDVCGAPRDMLGFDKVWTRTRNSDSHSDSDQAGQACISLYPTQLSTSFLISLSHGQAAHSQEVGAAIDATSVRR